MSSVCGKLELGELVCRPEGRVWRGADPQAHPRSAIDCSAFPINYSLIMENRQHWLHGSGSSSHVAGRGTGQPCLYLPAHGSGSHLGDSDSLCFLLWTRQQRQDLSDGMSTGWRWEPRGVRGGSGNCPRGCMRGQLPTAEGTIGRPLI